MTSLTCYHDVILTSSWRHHDVIITPSFISCKQWKRSINKFPKTIFRVILPKSFVEIFESFFFQNSGIFEKKTRSSQNLENSRPWIFLRKSLFDTVPHDDVTCLLVVVTMSPISVTKVIWSDLSKLTCVMFMKFSKKKFQILHVKSILKIIPENNDSRPPEFGRWELSGRISGLSFAESRWIRTWIDVWLFWTLLYNRCT